MSVATHPSSVSPPPTRLWPLRRFTVDEYHRMIDAAVLTEDDPVELLEGWIVYKITRNPPHDVSLGLTGDALAGRLPAGWHVRDQCAVTTGDSEPEPDLAIARGARRDYLTRHPGPNDLALVVEVSESSLEADREDKGRIYARAGIPVYWIVNLVDRRVEIYRDPTGPAAVPAYRTRTDYGPNDVVPFAIPGHAPTDVPVRELLP